MKGKSGPSLPEFSLLVIFTYVLAFAPSSAASLSLCTVIQSLNLQPSKHFRRRAEKTNKSELQNPLRSNLHFRGWQEIFQTSDQFLRAKIPKQFDA